MPVTILRNLLVGLCMFK